MIYLNNMMPELVRGLTHPAKFGKIIKHLFQNRKINYQSNAKAVLTFSAARLTAEQKASLVYAEGFTPIGAYVICETDNYGPFGDTTIPFLIEYSLISFVQKANDFIYAYYFDVTNITLDVKVLKKSKDKIDLSSTAVIVLDGSSELFTKVKNTVVGLGLLEGPAETNLEYTHGSKYLETRLSISGIIDTTISKTKLEGLSYNMKNLQPRHLL
jgi:hypothetical protein